MPDMERFLRRQQQVIDQTGWTIMHIIATQQDPRNRRAVHLHRRVDRHQYPELLMTGLNPQVAQSLLNDVAARVYDKAQRVSHGQHLSDLVEGYDAILVEGSPSDQLWPGAASTQITRPLRTAGRRDRGRLASSPAGLANRGPGIPDGCSRPGRVGAQVLDAV